MELSFIVVTLGAPSIELAAGSTERVSALAEGGGTSGCSPKLAKRVGIFHTSARTLGQERRSLPSSRWVL